MSDIYPNDERDASWKVIRQGIFDKFAFNILRNNKLPDDAEEIRSTNYLPVVLSDGTKLSITCAPMVTEFYTLWKRYESGKITKDELPIKIKDISWRFGNEFKNY